MNHFDYRDGVLCAEDVPLSEIAAAVGTPFYCYSTATLERHFRVFSEAMPQGALVAYAVKANGSLAVIKTLAKLGAGADIVSGGELKKALAAGVPADKIVFSGVGKTRAEMAAGLDARIYQFNVEGEEELDALSEVASSKGATASVALRVNPDVDAKTHAKISTGKAENKFGIAWGRVQAAFAHAATLPGIRVAGVALHIGSQITELGPYREAFAKAVALVKSLRADGYPRRGLGRSLQRQDRPALAGELRRGRSRGRRRLGCSADRGTGPLDHGECGRACFTSALCEARRGQGVPYPGCRYERPDPPCPLRRLARYRAGPAHVGTRQGLRRGGAGVRKHRPFRTGS
jgi:hypothetical protein